MKYNYLTKSYFAYIRGVDFANAVEALEKSDQHFFAPPVVNAAFSCELLLKAIIIAETQREECIKKHRLNELFTMMLPNTQDTIKTKANIYDWDSFMREANNAFVEWRYMHEEYKDLLISIFDLQRFIYALKLYYEETYHIPNDDRL